LRTLIPCEFCAQQLLFADYSGIIEFDASQKSIFGLASRSIYELTLNEIFNNDIDHFLEVNHLVEQAEAWDYEIVLHNRLKEVVKNFEAVIINPSSSFDIGNPLVSSKRLVQSRYDHGHEVASNKNYESFKNK
jgi:hypothetical protein